MTKKRENYSTKSGIPGTARRADKQTQTALLKDKGLTRGRTYMHGDGHTIHARERTYMHGDGHTIHARGRTYYTCTGTDIHARGRTYMHWG